MTHRYTHGWLGLFALLGITAGCAGPLVVSSAQSRGDEVKFAYTQQGSRNQGIIECKQSGDGDLHSCRHMHVEFVE